MPLRDKPALFRGGASPLFQPLNQLIKRRTFASDLPGADQPPAAIMNLDAIGGRWIHVHPGTLGSAPCPDGFDLRAAGDLNG